MKKKTVMGLLCFVLSISVVGSAAFAMIGPQADVVFKSASVSLSSSGSATFKATTDKTIKKLYVSSVSLQVKSGSEWSDLSATAPSTVASDTNSYMAKKDYSGSMSSKKTYRIKAVFSADGHTLTKYSGSITY